MCVCATVQKKKEKKRKKKEKKKKEKKKGKRGKRGNQEIGFSLEISDNLVQQKFRKNPVFQKLG